MGALKLRNPARVICITAAMWPTIANYKGRFEMRGGMTEWKPARNGLLLQTLETALAFFATEEAGRPFRSEWRISLHLRDSGIPHAILPATAFRPMRLGTRLPACTRRILKGNSTVAKANEPSAPDQETQQL